MTMYMKLDIYLMEDSLSLPKSTGFWKKKYAAKTQLTNGF